MEYINKIMDYQQHQPVLYQEILDSFAQIKRQDFFVDCTFGGGGHSGMLFNEFKPRRMLAFDQDPDALKNGQKIIQSWGPHFELIDSNFENIDQFVQAEQVDGILADLGVSSHHFDQAERGFSFRFSGPLDMRMNPRTNLSAADIINTFSQQELSEIFLEYGEERLADRIAKEIVAKRSVNELSTTKDLEDIVFHCYPKHKRFGKTHPATRVFQALRIYVNRELEILKETLPKLMDCLASGGRLHIISFHSLEDRIVKQAFKNRVKENSAFKILTKRPLIASDQELSNNPRSRSAKLRILERVI